MPECSTTFLPSFILLDKDVEKELYFYSKSTVNKVQRSEAMHKGQESNKTRKQKN